MNISYHDDMSNASGPNVAILDDKSTHKPLPLPRKSFRQLPGQNAKDNHNNNFVRNDKFAAVFCELTRNIVSKDGIYQSQTPSTVFLSSKLSSTSKKSTVIQNSSEKITEHESSKFSLSQNVGLPKPRSNIGKSLDNWKPRLPTPPPIRPKPAYLCNKKAISICLKTEISYSANAVSNSQSVVSNLETSESDDIYEDVIPLETQNLTPDISKEKTPILDNCTVPKVVSSDCRRHNSLRSDPMTRSITDKRRGSLENRKSGSLFSALVSVVKDLGVTTQTRKHSSSVFYSESDNVKETSNIESQKSNSLSKEKKVSSVFYDNLDAESVYDNVFCGEEPSGSLQMDSGQVCAIVNNITQGDNPSPSVIPVILENETIVSDITSVNSTHETSSNLPLIQISPEETSNVTNFDEVLNPQCESSNNKLGHVSRYSADMAKTEKNTNDYKVFKIAEEMVLSEQVFVDVLKLLNEDFRKEVEKANLESEQSIIPDLILNQILMYLPQLQTFNEQLLQDLTDRIANWENDPRIADIIMKKGPFLKLYTSYIKEFERMTSTLDDALKKYRQFSQVVKTFEMSSHCKKLALKHYMLKPIQRIPQYKLLLEDYLKHLSEDALDYKDAVAALKIVSEVADHINDSMKQGEALEKMVALQNSLQGYEIIKPGRILLKEGNLLKLSRKGIQPRKFYLFNDCLLYVTLSHDNIHKVNHELPLVGMKVSIPSSEGFENEFSILSVKRSIRVSVQTLEERDEWIKALSTAIDKVTSRKSTFSKQHSVDADELIESREKRKLGEHAPVWIPDARVTMCQICLSEFTLTFRRHHCRACGKVICSECSHNRCPLPYINNTLARVCDECSQVLEAEENDKDVIEEQSEISPFFKKSTSGAKEYIRKIKRYVPNILKEVSANDEGAEMSGYLHKRKKTTWKKFWFVLKDKVLYTYKASQDCAALESIPILGYAVHDQPPYNIELAHSGQPPIAFQADSEKTRQRWVIAMKEACVL